MLIKLLSIMVMAAVVACGPDVSEEPSAHGNASAAGGGSQRQEIDQYADSGACAKELGACSASVECMTFARCLSEHVAVCAGRNVSRAGLSVDMLCLDYMRARHDDVCSSGNQRGFVEYMTALTCAELTR